MLFVEKQLRGGLVFVKKLESSVYSHFIPVYIEHPGGNVEQQLDI